MPLSPFAARALDEAEKSTCMLHAAGYFTEEEWIKLDGLIHKGNYVFTNGPYPSTSSVHESTIKPCPRICLPPVSNEQKDPAKSLLDLDDWFDDGKEVMKASGPISNNQINKVLQEEGLSPLSPSSYKHDGLFSPAGSSRDSPSSSIGDDDRILSDAHASTDTDIAAKADPKTLPILENKPGLNSSNISGASSDTTSKLPPNVALDQLQEAKGFQAELKREKVSPQAPIFTPARFSTDSKRDGPHPDWASEVNSEVARNEVSLRSKTPVPVSLRDSQGPRPKLSITTAEQRKPLSAAEDTRRLAAFKGHFRRLPKSNADYYQPNNPQFNPRWLTQDTARLPAVAVKSPIATAKASSAKTSSKDTSRSVSYTQVKAGSLYVIARTENPRGTCTLLPTIYGDKIKIIKPVSGNMFLAQNLRTEQAGQVSATHLEHDVSTSVGFVVEKKSQLKPFSIDDIERRNAAEWETDDYEVTLPISSQPAPMKIDSEWSTVEKPERKKYRSHASGDKRRKLAVPEASSSKFEAPSNLGEESARESSIPSTESPGELKESSTVPPFVRGELGKEVNKIRPEAWVKFG